MIPLLFTTTDPGSRCTAGSITKTPCTLGKSRSAMRSLATPFCRHRIGTSLGATAASWSRAAQRLMRLGGQQHDVVLAPVDVGGIVDGRDVEDHLAVGIAQAQAVARQRLEVGPARHEHHRVPVLMEAATGGTSDRTRTDHDVPHRPSISGRGPDMPNIRPR